MIATSNKRGTPHEHGAIEGPQRLRSTDEGRLRRKPTISSSMSAEGCCRNDVGVESVFSTHKLKCKLTDDRNAMRSAQRLLRSHPLGREELGRSG